MATKVDIWMPLYIGDYLADTSHLDATRHGAYLLFLMHYWRKGPLVNDRCGLMNIARLSNDSWTTAEAVLSEFFTLEDDGKWHQERQDIEREKAAGQKRRGTAGAGAKWGMETSQERGKVTRSQRLAEARRKGTHTPEEWVSLQAFCSHQCVKCQASNVELVKDHILPVYKGGSDSISNIQPLCRTCNAQKGPETTDYRKDGWQNACKTSASSVHNACPLPLPLPLPIEKQVQIPSRAKNARAAKPPKDFPTKTDLAKQRHAEFKAIIAEYWDSKNKGVQMPWDGREGKHLEMFLRAAPDITAKQFRGFLRNRFKSDVNHGERASQWIAWVTNYAQGPMDRFGKTIGTKSALDGVKFWGRDNENQT
jgi:uncharacterized protein YdaU (DUF1376 family)